MSQTCREQTCALDQLGLIECPSKCSRGWPRSSNAAPGKPKYGAPYEAKLLVELVEVERQLDLGAALGRQVHRHGQKQVAVSLSGRRMRRFQAGVDAREPAIGFFPHRTPQLAIVHVSRRIASEEIDVALELGLVVARGIAGADRLLGRHHQIAMGVLDVDVAFGAND